jgi:hypothetical protein
MGPSTRSGYHAEEQGEAKGDQDGGERVPIDVAGDFVPRGLGAFPRVSRSLVVAPTAGRFNQPCYHEPCLPRATRPFLVFVEADRFEIYSRKEETNASLALEDLTPASLKRWRA